MSENCFNEFVPRSRRERTHRTHICSMGGGSGSSSQTMEFKPPAYAAPYWASYVQQAGDLTSQPKQMYAGSRDAELGPQTYQAMDMATQRALNGAPDLNAARGMAMNVSQGQYLNNPYLSSQQTNAVIGDTASNMANAHATGTAAQNDAMFSRGNAFGGSAWQQKQTADAAALAQQVGQMGNQYRLANQNQNVNAYQTGVNQMLQGGQLGGQLAQDDWTAASKLAGVGDMQRAYQQQLLDRGYNTWQEGQMAPFQNLDVMGNALARASGGMGQNVSTSSQGGFSPLAGLLGGAGIAYGLGLGGK